MRGGRLYNPWYSDVCVVVGPNLHWALNDLEDLQRYEPEALLGYRVVVTTVAEITHGALRGLRPWKVIIFSSGKPTDSEFARAYNELQVVLQTSGTPHRVPEWYRVHRGLDPVVKRI